LKKKHVAAAGTAALILAATVPFLTKWEGVDRVAKRDPIGTGHPITYCNGLTSVDGSVKVGQRFTPAQCDARLAKVLPIYLAELQACVKVEAPVKVMAAALDATFNAGGPLMCRSRIVQRINARDFAGACEAFKNYAITTQHGRVVVPGLVHRRRGDYRQGEYQLCMEGVKEGLPKKAEPMPWWQRWARVLTWKA
jgi:lysozyme